MTDTPDDRITDLPQSESTAEQLLTQLTKLIINTTDVRQLTRQVVENAFRIQLGRSSEDTSSYAARITSDWNIGIEVNDHEDDGRGVRFEFFESGGDRPPMTSICALDADAFGAELQRAGFIRTAQYGIHGERLGADYRRGALQVVASTGGEAGEPTEAISHACIKAVEIQQHG